MSVPENGVSYRLHVVEEELKEGGDISQSVKLANKHEWELHGERGINAELREIKGLVRWMNRALWSVAGSVIVASIVFVIFGGGHPG